MTAAAQMTAAGFTVTVAALCKPGEAALTLIDAAEGLSWCVASAQTAYQTARSIAAEPDGTLLGVAVIGAEGTLTGYYAALADLTEDDALAAAEALAEISAGHEEGAAAVLTAARLDALTNGELEALCSRFGAEP